MTVKKKSDLEELEYRIRDVMNLVESLQYTCVNEHSDLGVDELSEAWSLLHRVKERVTALHEKE